MALIVSDFPPVDLEEIVENGNVQQTLDLIDFEARAALSDQRAVITEYYNTVLEYIAQTVESGEKVSPKSIRAAKLSWPRCPVESVTKRKVEDVT